MEGSLLKLTLKQRVFLLEFWWKYEYDYEKVCAEFRVSYPSVNIPTRHEIQKLNRIFRENGTVASLPPMKSAIKKETNSGVHRKRGRPSKASLGISSSTKTINKQNNTGDLPKKRGRPKKIVTIDNNQPPPKKLKTEKRKRGRRPFNVEVINGLPNESEDPTVHFLVGLGGESSGAPKKRGRPPMSDKSKPLTNGIPKKRGRPPTKKQEVINVDSATEKNDKSKETNHAETNGVVRKRGRPRKFVAPKTEEPTPTSDDKKEIEEANTANNENETTIKSEVASKDDDHSEEIVLVID